MSARLRLADVLGNGRVAAALTLGFASGLPFNLSQGTLQAWLATLDLSLRTIGWLTWVGMPYLLKPIWAPLLDRYVPPFLGRRRGWIVLFQAGIALSIAALGLQAPNEAIYAVAALALLMSTLSASQDVVIDAYRTDALRAPERGVGSAAVQLGWRMANLVSGALCLILSHYIGWRDTYFLMAAVMAGTVLLTLAAPEPERVVEAPRTLRAALVEPLAEFMGRPGAVAMLALIILYKVGDAAALSLSSAFLIKGVGFTTMQVGAVAKTTSISAILIGTAVAGVVYARIGLYRSLMVFGVLQAVSNLLYSWLALTGPSIGVMFIAVGVDNLAGSMGATVFGALTMALCDARFSAFQFALLSALAGLARTVIGPIAAVIVEHIGWAPFFVVTFTLGLPGLVLLRLMRDRVTTLDTTA